MSATPVLSITNASVVYPDGTSTVTALDSANVEIFPGELVAIVGESGSGKSTLLSIAGFLQDPTSGTVTLHGAEGLDATSTRREHIGFVFQQPNLLGSLTAREQLLITDRLRGTKPRQDRADELFARVGLEGLGGRRVAQLSGGQRQRVNIARALMGNPQLLLADEPTSALDARLSKEIVELLRDVTKEFDLATLMVTHDRSQLAYADRFVEMADGKALQTA